MFHSFTARVATFVAALPVLCGSADSQIPAHLSHTAPFLGHPLTIRVEGAAPSAAIDLLFSPSAGSFDGPYGHLELARGSVQTVATGVALPDGTWSVDLPVPLDPALAETERHYQALVDDPSAPAGRRLSDAIHIRLLGPRMYAGHAGGFDVYNAVDKTVATHVNYAPEVFAKPVFDASFSRGAVMSTSKELLFFDPFFGGVQGTIPFATDCSSTLITDASHSTLYVLETGGDSAARIHAIEFSTGAETSYLDLPNPVGGSWCEGSPGVEMFVGEAELTGQSSIRLIGMQPLADLGSGIVGDPTWPCGAPPVLYAGGTVFSWVMVPDPQSPYYPDGLISRSRVVGSEFSTNTVGIGRSGLYAATPVPEAGLVLAALQSTMGPGAALVKIPISPSRSISGLPWIDGTTFMEQPNFMEADGKTAWVVGHIEASEGDFLLFRFDFETNTWTRYPNWWFMDYPTARGVIHDALVHEFWVAAAADSYNGIRTRLTCVGEVPGNWQRVPLPHRVDSLFAVPIP